MTHTVMDQINFWGHKQEYFEFSNFARYPFRFGEHIWPTSEHFYQAMKFKGQTMEHNGKTWDVVTYVRECLKTPRDACNFGRERAGRREDWEEVKEKYMFLAIYHKFVYNFELAGMLIRTGQADIVEASPYDYYWGAGKDRTGRNRLGVLLMSLRWHLKNDDNGWGAIHPENNPYRNFEWTEKYK